ncbi:MAG: metalloregulator ArsR/SmtB family transcription factor [Terracidiphilus sp.]
MKPAMSDASCELLGGFFTIFAHATRMRILCALQQKPMSVTEIANHAGLTVTNTSQHLRLMRDRGAVIAEKRAQNVYYRIADPRFAQAMLLIREALLEQMQQETKGVSASAPRRKRSKVLQPA